MPSIHDVLSFICHNFIIQCVSFIAILNPASVTRCSGDCRLCVWQSCHVQCDVKRNTLYKPVVSIITYPFFKFLNTINFICPSRHAERRGLMQLAHWCTNVWDQHIGMFYVFCMWGVVLTFFFPYFNAFYNTYSSIDLVT
jgi:hypothetical protein